MSDYFKQLFDQAPVAYQSLDAAGCFLDVNKTWLDILGYKKEEVIGKWFGDFISPRLVDAFRERFSRFKKNGEVEVDVEVKCKNGTLRTVHFIGKVGHDEHGKFKQTHCVFFDMTEQKKKEQALIESEKKYRTIVETVAEGVWVIDENANTTFVNTKMAVMLGYTYEEMMGKPLFSFMDDLAKKDAEYYFERRRQGIAEQHDFRFKHKNGKDVWTILNTNPLFDDSGNFLGALGMITNITERKRAEREMQQKNEELTRFNKLIINRELKMIELKDRIRELERQLGQR
ncbi:MAG: PAS domain S-box protein [archaeon]